MEPCRGGYLLPVVDGINGVGGGFEKANIGDVILSSLKNIKDRKKGVFLSAVLVNKLKL